MSWTFLASAGDGRHVGHELVGDGGAVRLEPALPEVLLETVVAREGHPLLHDVLASVDLRIQVAERLSHRLDALPGQASPGVEHLGGGDVAGLHRGGELGGPRDEVVGLRADVGRVGGDRGGDLLVGLAGRGRARHGEGGADAVADHAGLARRRQGAGLGDLELELAAQTGGDVLDLTDDAVAGRVDVELVDLAALVGHPEGDRPGARGGRAQGALGVGGADGDGAGGGPRAPTGRTAGRRGPSSS